MTPRSTFLAALLLTSSLANAQEAPIPGMPQVLARPIRAGLTLEGYLSQVMSPFRSLLRERPGIDAAGIRSERDAMTQRAEQEGVARIIVFDSNGDGKVTEDEVRAGIRARSDTTRDGAAYLAMIERQVQEIMAADTNKDGIIDVTEMRAAGVRARSRGYAFQAVPEDYLPLVPDGGMLTPSLLLKRAQAAFETVDANGDATLSRDEVDATRRVTASPARDQAAMPVSPAQARPLPLPPSQAVRASSCDMPRPAAEDKVLAYGSYEGGAYSTAALGDVNAETRTGVVVVEPGTEPLYVVLSTFLPMIWRFEGDVGRVHTVVLTSAQGKEPMAGVTGLPAGKVAYTPPSACLKLWSGAESIEGAVARGVLTSLLGRRPDGMAGSYTALKVSVPSLTVDDGKGRARPEPLPGMSGWLGAMAFQGAPGGLVDIDAKTVVADGTVLPYDILPGALGIAQLTKDGALVDLGRSQYKVTKTFAHFPARLSGSVGGVQFLLGQGVNLPGGDTGWSCIVSEDTGKPVKPSPLCR